MSAPSSRRRFQYGLRELFWLALVIALAIFGVREYRERRRLEQDERSWAAARNEWYEKFIAEEKRSVTAEQSAKQRDYWQKKAMVKSIQRWCMAQGWDSPTDEELSLEAIGDQACYFRVETKKHEITVRIDTDSLEVLEWTPAK